MPSTVFSKSTPDSPIISTNLLKAFLLPLTCSRSTISPLPFSPIIGTICKNDANIAFKLLILPFLTRLSSESKINKVFILEIYLLTEVIISSNFKFCIINSFILRITRFTPAQADCVSKICTNASGSFSKNIFFARTALL